MAFNARWSLPALNSLGFKGRPTETRGHRHFIVQRPAAFGWSSIIERREERKLRLFENWFEGVPDLTQTIQESTFHHPLDTSHKRFLAWCLRRLQCTDGRAHVFAFINALGWSVPLVSSMTSAAYAA